MKEKFVNSESQPTLFLQRYDAKWSWSKEGQKKLHIYETEDKNIKLFEKYVSNRKQFENANGLMKKLN